MIRLILVAFLVCGGCRDMQPSPANDAAVGRDAATGSPDAAPSAGDAAPGPDGPPMDGGIVDGGVDGGVADGGVDGGAPDGSITP